jgi:hypothetical protein
MIDKTQFLKSHGWIETYGKNWIRGGDSNTWNCLTIDQAFVAALKTMSMEEYQNCSPEKQNWIQFHLYGNP